MLRGNVVSKFKNFEKLCHNTFKNQKSFLYHVLTIEKLKALSFSRTVLVLNC